MRDINNIRPEALCRSPEQNVISILAVLRVPKLPRQFAAFNLFVATGHVVTLIFGHPVVRHVAGPGIHIRDHDEFTLGAFRVPLSTLLLDSI